MDDIDRKDAIRDYKDMPRQAGVFAVRNIRTGCTLLGSSPDLPSMLNRQRFQLESGGHPDKSLQADYDALGEQAFAFEIIDELEPGDDSGHDSAADLEVLRGMWRQRLESQGVPLYRSSYR